MDRLEHLRRNGPTAHAFTFSQRYPPPGLLPVEPPDPAGESMRCPSLQLSGL
ncbi:MAG: DUF3291 domain-containing protein [Gammaproteobacteria bacterium]|nr:MAG: DUF3291 domain-containing protein [Gammaproteobacteria bacterium]